MLKTVEPSQPSPKPKKKKQWDRQAAIFSALRRAHRNSPTYKEALARAKSEYFIASKRGKQMRRVHFQCAKCGVKANRKAVAVDHISPVICPNEGYTTLDNYANRLFCPIDNLQILCNNGKQSCHKIKSKAENQIRKLKRGK